LAVEANNALRSGAKSVVFFYLFVVLDCLVNGRFLLINSDILIVERLLAFIDLDRVGSIDSDTVSCPQSYPTCICVEFFLCKVSTHIQFSASGSCAMFCVYRPRTMITCVS